MVQHAIGEWVAEYAPFRRKGVLAEHRTGGGGAAHPRPQAKGKKTPTPTPKAAKVAKVAAPAAPLDVTALARTVASEVKDAAVTAVQAALMKGTEQEQKSALVKADKAHGNMQRALEKPQP